MKNPERGVPQQDQLMTPKKESELEQKNSPQSNTKITATTSSEDVEESDIEEPLRWQHFAG